MAKRALIILADGFEEIEAITCIDILRRCGIEVTVAGLKRKIVKGAHNLKVIADKKLKLNASINCFTIASGIYIIFPIGYL